MKNLALLISLVFGFTYGQEKNCSEFKTGKFEYVSEEYPEQIVRNDTIQIEINPISKIEIYSTIEWVSECEYILTYKKVLNSPLDESEYIGKQIYVEIIETKGNKYKVHASSDVMNTFLEFARTD
jgi:hypothetical protein